jgi:tRNA-binding protein
MIKETVSFDHFEALDIRVGTIISAQEFPEARKPAYKLEIDFGDEIGVKKSSAQLTEVYTAEALVDKQILAVVNFAPKQIGKFISECLVLGLYNQMGVILAVPNIDCKNGDRLG